MAKWKLYGLLLILLLLSGAGFYGYRWYLNTAELFHNAKANESLAGKYIFLDEALQSERSRCIEFIAQQQGDFSSFAYCQKFIEWADALLNLEP